MDGKPWRGSKAAEDLYMDVDNYFRDIRSPQFHEILSPDDPIRMPPAIDDVGINLLDKTLRDMTGLLYADRHLLTHDAESWTSHEEPCWTCRRAGTRQVRKYQAKFQKKRKRYEHRNVNKNRRPSDWRLRGNN